MSTSFPSPSRVSGDDWNEIAKEIVVLTTILKNHRSEGITHSMPKDPELQLFQHLSVLVTTGELGRKITDRNASTANATSGRIEADRIVLVLVTPNALPESEDSGGTWNIVKPTANDLRGGQLLLGWKYSKCVLVAVAFIRLNDCHLQSRYSFRLASPRRCRHYSPCHSLCQ